MHFTHFQVFYVKKFITVCIEQKAQQKQVNKYTYPTHISCIFKYKYFATNMANHRHPHKPTDWEKCQNLEPLTEAFLAI